MACVHLKSTVTLYLYIMLYTLIISMYIYQMVYISYMLISQRYIIYTFFGVTETSFIEEQLRQTHGEVNYILIV